MSSPREAAAFAVFEPFIADLVSANVKVPTRPQISLGSLASCCLVEPHGCRGHKKIFLNLRTRWAAVGSKGFVEPGRFQKMQSGEFPAELSQAAEQLHARREREGAGKITLEKLRVAAPVAGTVKYPVGVVEDVFGREALG